MYIPTDCTDAHPENPRRNPISGDNSIASNCFFPSFETEMNRMFTQQWHLYGRVRVRVCHSSRPKCGKEVKRTLPAQSGSFQYLLSALVCNSHVLNAFRPHVFFRWKSSQPNRLGILHEYIYKDDDDGNRAHSYTDRVALWRRSDFELKAGCELRKVKKVSNELNQLLVFYRYIKKKV